MLVHRPGLRCAKKAWMHPVMEPSYSLSRCQLKAKVLKVAAASKTPSVVALLRLQTCWLHRRRARDTMMISLHVHPYGFWNPYGNISGYFYEVVSRMFNWAEKTHPQCG